MIICKTPIEIDRFDFLLEHLDCDAIADTREEDITDKVKIIAYSESESDNKNLRNYFYQSDFSGRYRILANISTEEVNSIDCL